MTTLLPFLAGSYVTGFGFAYWFMLESMAMDREPMWQKRGIALGFAAIWPVTVGISAWHWVRGWR